MERFRPGALKAGSVALCNYILVPNRCYRLSVVSRTVVRLTIEFRRRKVWGICCLSIRAILAGLAYFSDQEQSNTIFPIHSIWFSCLLCLCLLSSLFSNVFKQDRCTSFHFTWRACQLAVSLSSHRSFDRYCSSQQWVGKPTWSTQPWNLSQSGHPRDSLIEMIVCDSVKTYHKWPKSRSAPGSSIARP